MLLSVFAFIVCLLFSGESVPLSFGRIWHTIKVRSGGALLLRHTVGTVVLNTWWKRQKNNGGY